MSDLDTSERRLRAAAALFFKHQAEQLEGLLTEAQLLADWEEHYLTYGGRPPKSDAAQAAQSGRSGGSDE